MRVVTLGLILIVMAVLIVGCSAQMVSVRSGEEVLCSGCGKTVSSNVTTKSVPVAEASKYSVTIVKKLCDDCERKEAEKRRAEEVKRAEAERIANMGRVAGRWIWSMNIGTWELLLREDGTGTFDHGKNVSWQPAEGGFTGVVTWDQAQQSGPSKHYRSTISGTMHSNGQKMTIQGYGFFGYGRDQSCEMERAD